MPATRAARSGSATYRDSPSLSVSLNENGTLISRPSNSGMATWVAASSGLSPAPAAAHCARGAVTHSACSTGTSSAAIAPVSHASSSPPACAAAGVTPPAASTVTISASAWPSTSTSPASADRRLAHQTGSGRAPAAATARASSSMNAAFPASSCAR